MSILSAITSIQSNIPRTSVESPAVKNGGEYREIEQVRRRATVIAGSESPEQRNAIDRLEQTLSANEPPRNDVPRGYYLDILV